MTVKNTPATSVVDLPPMFIFDAAVGLYPLVQLCENYGYPTEFADYLLNESAFMKAVKEQEAELDKTGVSFKIRSGIIADEALQKIRERIQFNDTPTPILLDAFKTLSKFAGREPAAGQQQLQGSGFSISIIFGDNAPKHATKTVTVDNPPQATLVSASADGNPEYEYY
jgi:hypothetical protein